MSPFFIEDSEETETSVFFLSQNLNVQQVKSSTLFQQLPSKNNGHIRKATQKKRETLLKLPHALQLVLPFLCTIRVEESKYFKYQQDSKWDRGYYQQDSKGSRGTGTESLSKSLQCKPKISSALQLLIEIHAFQQILLFLAGPHVIIWYLRQRRAQLLIHTSRKCLYILKK